MLGAWGEALEETRELSPVLVGRDGAGTAVLLDRVVYVEDAQGGYWTLASGASVLDTQGHAIPRATLQDVLAQAAASGATWHIEQTWSPSDRTQALNFRDEAPYLMRAKNGRAICLRRGKATGSGRKSWSGRSRAGCRTGSLEVRCLAA